MRRTEDHKEASAVAWHRERKVKWNTFKAVRKFVEINLISERRLLQEKGEEAKQVEKSKLESTFAPLHVTPFTTEARIRHAESLYSFE